MDDQLASRKAKSNQGTASNKKAESKTETAKPETVTIPVSEERLSIGKRTVETGRLHIHTTVHERQERVDPPLLEERAEVERIAVNRIVASVPEVRQEGDVLIVPVMEEVLVVEKRLLLREELHIRRRQTEIHRPQEVTLRREEVEIRHDASDGKPEQQIEQDKSPVANAGTEPDSGSKV